MPKIIIKLVEDDSIEDILEFDTEEKAIEQEKKINVYLNNKKYYLERVK